MPLKLVNPEFFGAVRESQNTSERDYHLYSDY